MTPPRRPEAGPQSPTPAVPQVGIRAWIQGVVETLVVRFGLIGVGMAGSVVLARVLGPEGRGELYLAMMLSAVGATVLNFGIHSSNTFVVSRDRTLLGATVSNSLAFAFGAGLAVCGAATVVELTDAFSLPVSGAMLLVVLLAVPLHLAYLQIQPLLLVVDAIHSYNLVEAMQRGSALVVVAALWWVGGITPLAVVFWMTLILLLSIAWIATMLRRAGGAVSWRPSIRLFRSSLPFARRAYLGGMASLLLIRIDVVIINAKLGLAAVGLYSIAASVGELLQLVPTTIGTLLFPRLSAMDDEAARWKLAVQTAWVTAAFLTVACAGMYFASELAIRVTYGHEYLGGASALRWLLPGIVLLGVNSILMNYFASIGMPRVAIVAPIVGLAVNVGLNLILIPARGIEGAALASTLAYGLMAGICGVWMSRHAPTTIPGRVRDSPG